MIEDQQSMRGTYVAHGGNRAPFQVQKSPESLHLQQRGNYNDDLTGRYRPARRVNPDPIGLFVIGW